MTAFGKVGKSLGLLTGAALAALLTAAPRAAAEPGEKAASQKRYPAIEAGARDLLKAVNILEKGDDKFKGHRETAVKEIREALTELDEAVQFADKTDKPGDKAEPTFEAGRGKLAASQDKYPAIKGGAEKVIEAGRTLDEGLDKFGGHRVKALRALNRALEELEKAVKDAK
jgi:hypothetical protein